MKTQFTNTELPTSVWQSLPEIDHLLGQRLPWAGRLEEINNILLKTVEVDGIWLLTINPLPAAACGSISTPLAVAPDAQVQLADKAPPRAHDWPPLDSLLGQTIASKKPYFTQPGRVVNNQFDSDLGDALFDTFHVILSAVIPLVTDNNPVGALIVASHERANAVLPKEKRNLLLYLGQHLAANLQNAYLVDRSRRHTGALRTLNQIAQTITSSLDIDDVLHRTMAGINEILEVEAGSLLLVDEQTGELYFKLTLRGENKQITSLRLQRGQGIAGWVVTNNQPVISNNAPDDKRFYRKIDRTIGFTTRTVLCVPLLIQGKPIGVLEVINKRSGPFNEDDRELLVSMAASLGIALRNAHLYEDARDRTRQVEANNRIMAAINTGYGLSGTAKIIFEEFSRLIPFDHMSISLLDDSKENVRQWIFSEYGCTEQTKLTIPLKKSTLAWIIEKNRGRIYDDITGSRAEGRTYYPDDQILLEDGIRSKIAIPLAAQKGLYGSLNMGHRRPGVYDLDHLNLLQGLTPQVAVAIEKAHLVDVMEQRTNQLQMLNRLGEMLISLTDLRLMVDTTLSMLPRLLPGNVQGVIVAGQHGAYLGAAVPFDFNKTEQVIERMLDTFAEMSEGDVSTELIYTKTIPGNMPVPANWASLTTLSFPILTRLGSMGIIYMASDRKEDLSGDLLHIFSLIGSQIAAGIENTHLFQQVEQEKARLTAILASSSDAILVVNSKGRVVLDNPAAWTVMGVEESQSDKLLSESTQNETLVHLFENAMQDGKPTAEIPLANNRTFFANLSPVSAGETGVVGWVATMHDVSHFKELNQLKNDFVNTVSHDLRSPLGGISIATSLISQLGPINDDQQELLETIETRVGAMKILIDDLLDVGRIEAGLDMEMEPRPLAPLISDVTTEMLRQANDKAIQLTAKIAKDLPPVMANTARLQQVMDNLVSNAIKYTPDQGSVTVKAFQQEEEIRIQVIDTGLGIPAADQPHIFEKFYRVRGDHVTEIKGTGLGLAITKSIVEKHHGRIWLESIFGQGSTFTVALPVYKG